MSHWRLFQFDWPTVSETDDAKETQMLYKFDYLPPGLFNQMQRRHRCCTSLLPPQTMPQVGVGLDWVVSFSDIMVLIVVSSSGIGWLPR